MKLENKVAIVTSSTKGIGLECALELAREGAIVYMAVRRVDDTLTIIQEYIDQGLKLIPVFFDATEESSYISMIETVVHAENKINILVNNFGIGKPKQDFDINLTHEDTFFEIIKLNLGSAFKLIQLSLPFFHDGGSIVNISSIGGIVPDINRIGYSVSKSAINSLTQQVAMSEARKGIRCNAVLPGLIATDAALNNMPEEFLSSFLSHVPLNRIGKPSDIAKAVLFFASDDSSFITGHLLDVAGGYGLGTPQYADMMKKSE